MTTIAWDGRALCSDSRCIYGHIKQRPVQKIFAYKGDFLAIGFCGSYNNHQAFIDWLLGKGEKPTIPSDTAAGVIVVDKDLTAWCYHSDGASRVPAATCEADGSGSPYAMGAMLAGANAYKAVEIAIKLDENSGGPVQCYDIPTRTLTGPFA